MRQIYSTSILVGLLLTLTACGSSSASSATTSQPAEKLSATGSEAADSASADSASADSASADSVAADSVAAQDVYSLSADSLEGASVALGDYRGKVTLMVNVASRCGYTRQYAGLQKLHSELKGRGFAVLGFPSNEFGGQEPGTAAEIREFCSNKFGVDFPMFAKVNTAGDAQSPVYSKLTGATGKKPGWNFCKYLVGKNGEVLGFYPSGVSPDAPELRQAIESALE